MAKNADDAGGSVGNTDNSKRGRGIPPGGRPSKSTRGSGKSGGADGTDKRAEDYGGGPIGGRGRPKK